MTTVSIDSEKFLIDGVPTHPGRMYKGSPVEGLLFNNRVVQALFDDENPDTVHQWVYPDTGVWDPDRNVTELCEALPDYKAHGCDAVTINLQGGMPITKTEMVQPWLNTAIGPQGELKPAYCERLERILHAADEAGVIVIVGLYYFGQDKYINDEEAVKRGVVNISEWLLKSGYENILIEINNETDIPHYVHDILKPHRIHELIALCKSVTHEGRRLIVSTSFAGGAYHMRSNGVLNRDDVEGLKKGLPTEAAVEVSDFVLVHTNEHDMKTTRDVVRGVRELAAFKQRPMPICINEDSVSVTNLFAALDVYAPWGYYDQGENNYCDGYQSVPVNWKINTPNKRAFFDGVAEITGRND